MQVQEIHTTLHKHLAKEEEQLLPLLLQHFTHAEQVSWISVCFSVLLGEAPWWPGPCTVGLGRGRPARPATFRSCWMLLESP